MPKFILEEAKVLIDLRQHDKAVQTLQEGVNLFGHLEELWFKLATVLSDQGHQAAALQTTDKAIELHPTSPAYHSLRGQILIKMGPDNWDNASVSLQQATTLYSGNSPVIHTLRQVDLLRSRSMLDVDQRGALLEEAQEFLKSALKSDSGHNKLQVAMASILLDLENEDYEQIESLIKDALKRRDNGDAHICKARLLIRQDNLIDVESHLDRAYKISRNNTAVNTVRGEYYLITGNPVLALKAFQSALDATSKGSPEFEQSKRHVEQVTAILAAQANVNYAEIGEDSINVVPLADENAEKRSPIVRRRSKTENTED